MYKRSNCLKGVGYLDLGFPNCVDSKKSTSGYIFLLIEGAVSWMRVKQTILICPTWR